MGIREDAAQSRMKKKVEEALRSKMKAQALKECDPLVAKFAECAKGRLFSVVWACRAQSKETNACLHRYTNDEAFEKYKKQYEEQALQKL
ncbi:uncharacterized protein [Physcomitrium patens]|uniref:COX assembly mitochondrial protein n=2 Tax=Physcomitrium patens TaxID=3218 RepID=A0A2K1IVP5_PHYPA|nr:uncharacterized protein DDB_G0275933-like [Physcomitrium patens]PNR33338.1 hypothetical protein PHYPA_025281 [Physcomitrium patens]|eukprot:XP_024357113.1 uncharacterized protein DDB_G0275933-like [Physcomitrella patens]